MFICYATRITLILIILNIYQLSFAGDPSAILEIYDIKKATWPQNEGNFVKTSESGGIFNISVGVGSTGDMGFGIAGVSVSVPPVLILEATLSGPLKTIDFNAFAGLIIDYHTPSGFIRRIGFPLTQLSESREDFVPTWGKSTKPDMILTPKKVASTQYQLDLAENAPIGWDGIIWLNTLVENTGTNTELQVRLPSVSLQQEANPLTGAEKGPCPPIDWKQVLLTGRTIIYGNLTEAENMALNQLCTHLPIQIPLQSFHSVEKDYCKKPLLVIGRVADLRGHFNGKVEQWEQLLKDEKLWRQEQGYLIKYYPEEDLLIAVSHGNLGLVYAISHLQRCLVDNPEPAIALEIHEMIEKPFTQERGVYINIGYGLSCGPITPDNWREKEWEDFVDDLVLSRATFWSFFLWTEIEHIYPDTTRLDLVGKNEHVFKMLKHAIQYSHKRGLRTSFIFTPTNIPAEMIARHPEWACQLEYTNNGGICSRHPAAYEMSKLIHQYQMKYFKDASEYDIAFYDPGGCMCEECRKRDVQLDQLVKQVEDFSRISWEVNPDARFGFWTWAVWRYERIHQYSLQNLLIPEIAKRLRGNENKVTVIDSFHGDIGSVPYFEEAKKHGFRTSNFVYQTNIEDGNVFLLPLFEFQKKWAALTQEKQLDETFLMIMEVKSKYPMAHFGCEFFWDASLTKEQAAERYALQLCGDIEIARQLRNGFLDMEQLTFEGVTGTEKPIQKAKRMNDCFQKVIESSPERRREELIWLGTTAKVYDILIRASNPRMEKDFTELENLKNEFISLLRSDPLFEHFANCCGDLFFDRLVGWVTNGFKQGYF